jgi:hypothetical protein
VTAPQQPTLICSSYQPKLIPSAKDRRMIAICGTKEKASRIFADRRGLNYHLS